MVMTMEMTRSTTVVRATVLVATGTGTADTDIMGFVGRIVAFETTYVPGCDASGTCATTASVVLLQ